MADAAAVILSAIQKLDSWLLQRADRRVDDYAKLCSLQLEKKDLLVGMAELWENNNEMLYCLLVEVADIGDVKKKKDKDKLYSIRGEMDDIWELNCREKLHSLLLEMFASTAPKMHKEKVFSLAVEMADLWKDSKGKLNKQKLYTWLANKTDLWEQEKLFRLLERMKFLDGLNELDWKNVEGVRNDLRFILNKLEDHGHLHYFMSDVAEMAHDVQLLFHLKDSDPFILFLQIFKNTRKARFLKLFFDEIKPIHKWLQEIEKRVRKFGEINNVREELVGPSSTYSESDDHAVGLRRTWNCCFAMAKLLYASRVCLVSGRQLSLENFTTIQRSLIDMSAVVGYVFLHGN